MVSRTGKRTYTGIERASAWKQKPTLLIPQSNPASTGASPARCVGRSPCDDPHRRVAAARRAGADAETAGDNAEPECQPCNSPVTIQPLGGLPAPAGDPGFQGAEPAAVA
jgi:hypothetical protein